MKAFICLFVLVAALSVATAKPQGPTAKIKGVHVSESKNRAKKDGFKTLGWKVKFPAFCRCQREIYDSFEGIIVAPRVDLVSWSRCDQFEEDKRKPQISYQGSVHQTGLLTMMDESGAYQLSLELAKEISTKDKTKNSRKYFGAGDKTFKFTRKSEWNFDMDLEVQSDTEPFKESFTMKNLKKLKDSDADKVMASILLDTIIAHHPDGDTVPGKLKTLVEQCRVQMGVDADPASDGRKRVEQLKKLEAQRTLDVLFETYTTCFKSRELNSLPDYAFAFIEKCLESVKS